MQPKPTTLPLEAGDRLTRAEFEKRYEAMRDVKKAELVEGVVYLPSPLRYRAHARPNRHLSTWLGVYESLTPGVEGGDNATTRIDWDNEFQPDAFLMISPECGGQAAINDDDYLIALPELAAEISASSASYDLGDKREVYRRNDVQEYIVWRVLEQAIDWWILREGQYEELAATPDNIVRSETFPGLWLDREALIAGDMARVLEVLGQGAQSPQHAAFVQELERRRN